MKIGISLRIDVSKIDKSRIYVGKKGKYLDLVSFIDTENTSEYGDNGTISQSTSQQERQDGLKLPIIGNAKIFYTDGGQSQNHPNHGQQNQQNNPVPDDDIPFKAFRCLVGMVV